jgi:hypothetical protein
MGWGSPRRLTNKSGSCYSLRQAGSTETISSSGCDSMSPRCETEPRRTRGEPNTHFTYAGLRARLEAAGYEILDCRYVGRCEMIFKARKPAAAALATAAG